MTSILLPGSPFLQYLLIKEPCLLAMQDFACHVLKSRKLRDLGNSNSTFPRSLPPVLGEARSLADPHFHLVLL